MISTVRVSILLACLILIGVTSSAQVSSRKKPTTKPSAERLSTVQIQRSMAIQMITALADEADRYKDGTLRAQIQARAADTLWDENPDYSRYIFRRAWKAAEGVDKENERLANETRETRAKTMGSRDGGLVMLTPTSSVRMEVLKLAARRDTEFAEDLLKKLSEIKEEDKASMDSLMFDPTEPPIAVAKRLEIATVLLEKDPERAIAFAQPALNDATSPGIIFLCTLRRKDRDVADKFYSQMLIHSGEDLKSDATSVSLLSSYLFTPNLIVTATRRGRIMNPFSDDKQAADYSPALRSTFFRVAADILLRPPPPLNQDTTSAGRAGTFFTIARLLPLFEQYAPSNVIAALKTQMLMLASEVPESWKSEDDSMLRVGLVPARPMERETVESLEQQLGKADSSAERDLLYLKAIQKGSGSGDLRIRDLAEKIEEATLREQARTFADLAIVRSAISTKNSDRVLRIVREGYLSPLHRVWALAMTASTMGKTDLIRALDVLSEATGEAMRIKVGDPSRVYALVCVAQSSLELDRIKAQNVAFDVIKSMNAVTDFNAEGGKLYAQVRAKNLIAMINSREQAFNMASFFESLSKQNLQLAISLANDVKSDAPRAAATLAIAGLMLKGQTGTVSLRE